MTCFSMTFPTNTHLFQITIYGSWGDIYCLGNFCYCDGVVIAYHSFNLSLALVQWTFIWTFGLTFGLTFSMSVTIDYLNILFHSYNSLSKVSNLSETSFSSLKSGRLCPSHSVPRKTSTSDASALGPFLEVFQCLFYGGVSTTARLELSDDSSIALHCQEDFCYISKFSGSVWQNIAVAKGCLSETSSHLTGFTVLNLRSTALTDNLHIQAVWKKNVLY